MTVDRLGSQDMLRRAAVVSLLLYAGPAVAQPGGDADLPPVVGPLIMREFSVSGLLNQSVFPAVSLKITNARAWLATTVRSRPCSSSSVFSRLR